STRLIGMLGVAGATALGTWAWRRKECLGLALGALFFTTLAPSLAIAIWRISETPVAERYLYLPTIGLCLLVPYVFGRMIENLRERPAARRAAVAGSLAAGALLFGSFALASIERNETWKDNLSLWTDTVAKAPNQGLPHLHLGLAYDRLEAATKE